MRIIVVVFRRGIVRGVGWCERRDRGSAEIHFEGSDIANRLVRNRVVGIADALGERRPAFVVRRGQKFHGAIPVAPPTSNFTIALGVVPAGCRASGARGGGDA